MSKNKGIIAIVVALLIALAAAAYHFYGDTDEGSGKGSPTTTKINFSGSEIQEEQNGRIIWTLTAETVDVDPKTKEVRMKNLKGTFNEEDGTVTTITAPAAHMSGDRKSMDMSGGIHAESTEGAKFDTEALKFDNVKKRLISNGAFTYVKNDVTITGDKMTADTALQKVIVEGHAQLKKQ